MNCCKPYFFALMIAVLAAGCAGNRFADPGAPANADPVEQAVATQTATTDVRKRAQVHTELGLLYLNQGSFDVALDEAKISLDADSSYAPAYDLQGLVYLQLGQKEKSESAFRQALNLASGDPEINNNYGWFLCQTGKIKESFAYFDLALRNPLYKNPAKAYSNAGICALMDKDDARGGALLFRSLKLDPSNLRAYYLLAESDFRNKRYEDARDWVKQLHTKMQPTAETAWLALKVDRKLGDREGESRNLGILRRNFRDSIEYQQMLRGEFD